jgi:hypothetical protein
MTACPSRTSLAMLRLSERFSPTPTTRSAPTAAASFSSWPAIQVEAQLPEFAVELTGMGFIQHGRDRPGRATMVVMTDAARPEARRHRLEVPVGELGIYDPTDADIVLD